jgi:signal transduction histidine kinase/sensor domain CHASE-containing protein/CheY-like chemotaxis protein
MTLRRKTLIVLGATLAGLTAALYIITRITLLRSFDSLQRQHVRQNVDRATNGIANELSIISEVVHDDSMWDEANDALLHPNPKFFPAEFPDSTFANIRLNLVAYVDDNGKVHYGSGFDLLHNRRTALPAGLDVYLVPGGPLLQHASLQTPTNGVILLPSGPMLVSSWAVEHSDGSGPSPGSAIMGRYLDRSEIERLSSTTNLELRALPMSALPPEFHHAASMLSAQAPTFVEALDHNSIAGYALISGIDGKPALLLQTVVPRSIDQQGRATFVFLMIALVLVAVVFGALSLALMERLVLTRLVDLGQKLAAIGSSGDPAARVPITGRDELTDLGGSINQMLDALCRTEEARRQSDARYQAFVQQSAEGIWRMQCTAPIPINLPVEEQVLQLARRAQLAECNYAMARIHGAANAQALIGAPLSEFLDPADSDDLAHLRSFVLNGYHLRDAETQKKKSYSGPRKHILHNLEGIIEGGHIVGGWGIQRDITEGKLMEEQLRQSQKMEAVGTLAGGVAHDFNNLLTVIKGYSRLLLDRVDQDEDLAPKLEQIEKAADRAAALTRQLLAFSRRQVMEPKVINLNTIVSNVTSMLQRLIGEHIEVVSALEPELGVVLADPGQLEQVIINLAVNARDAMPDGGKLLLQTRNAELDGNFAREHVGTRPGRYVQLTVKDSGIGMSAEIQAHIFEPFFTTKEMGRGTGLGLSTVYGIVKQSDGYIWVESEVGQGSTFVISLPRSDRMAEPAVARELPAAVRGSETVLLVEDHDALRELTSGVLRGSGYTVLEASNPGDAEEICRRHSDTIHLLVTDVVMPGASGHEMAARLLTQRPGLAVLYMSGYSSDLTTRKGMLTPGSAFLEKPFTPSVLRRKVREVLDSAHMIVGNRPQDASVRVPKAVID